MQVNQLTRMVAACVGMVALTQSATAQVPDNVVLDILRQCARIEDAGARLACFDNNVRTGDGTSRQSVPGSVALPQADPRSPGGIQGFGREDVRTPDRFLPPAGELEALTTRVTAVEQRGFGVYALTLDGGAEWIFAESVSQSYRVPRAGSTIEIDRGSLGSYLMRFDGQQSVPVRRLR